MEVKNIQMDHKDTKVGDSASADGSPTDSPFSPVYCSKDQMCFDFEENKR